MNINNFLPPKILYTGIFLFAILILFMVFRPLIDKNIFNHDITKNYQRTYSSEPGPELVLIYIGSSTCQAANSKRLPIVVDSIKIMLQNYAKSIKHNFTTIGISKDWVIKSGIEHLNKYGPFDEITTGRNWINSAIIKYVYQHFKGVPGVPQIIVLKRTLVNKSTQQVNQYAIKNESLVMRKLGKSEIKRWYKNSAPLDMSFK